LCFDASANCTRFACRHISVEVLHNTPDAPERLHPVLLIKEVVPLRALQLGIAPVFFDRSLLRHGSRSEILCVSIVDSELENADVMVQA